MVEGKFAVEPAFNTKFIIHPHYPSSLRLRLMSLGDIVGHPGLCMGSAMERIHNRSRSPRGQWGSRSISDDPGDTFNFEPRPATYCMGVLMATILFNIQTDRSPLEDGFERALRNGNRTAPALVPSPGDHAMIRLATHLAPSCIRGWAVLS